MAPLRDPALGHHYGDPADDLAAEQVGAAARARGWLTPGELQTLATWKSPRFRARIATNTEAEIEEAPASPSPPWRWHQGAQERKLRAVGRPAREGRQSPGSLRSSAPSRRLRIESLTLLRGPHE
jgi:hypothetical protein